MGFTYTTNMILGKPVIGTNNSDADPQVNTNFDLIDSIVNNVLEIDGELLTYEGDLLVTYL